MAAGVRRHRRHRPGVPAAERSRGRRRGPAADHPASADGWRRWTGSSPPVPRALLISTTGHVGLARPQRPAVVETLWVGSPRRSPGVLFVVARSAARTRAADSDRSGRAVTPPGRSTLRTRRRGGPWRRRPMGLHGLCARRPAGPDAVRAPAATPRPSVRVPGRRRPHRRLGGGHCVGGRLRHARPRPGTGEPPQQPVRSRRRGPGPGRPNPGSLDHGGRQVLSQAARTGARDARRGPQTGPGRRGSEKRPHRGLHGPLRGRGPAPQRANFSRIDRKHPERHHSRCRMKHHDDITSACPVRRVTQRPAACRVVGSGFAAVRRQALARPRSTSAIGKRTTLFQPLLYQRGASSPRARSHRHP